MNTVWSMEHGAWNMEHAINMTGTTAHTHRCITISAAYHDTHGTHLSRILYELTHACVAASFFGLLLCADTWQCTHEVGDGYMNMEYDNMAHSCTHEPIRGAVALLYVMCCVVTFIILPFLFKEIVLTVLT